VSLAPCSRALVKAFTGFCLELHEMVLTTYPPQLLRLLFDKSGYLEWLKDENKEEKIAFALFLNTLKVALKQKVEYLPKGERDDIETICAVWMDVGILLGKAPQLLADILKKTRAKISLLED